MFGQSQSVEELAREIADYLLEHPDAADSVDGIARWWLQRQRYKTVVRQVEEALSQLEKQGLVRRTTNASGGIVYRATSAIDHG